MRAPALWPGPSSCVDSTRGQSHAHPATRDVNRALIGADMCGCMYPSFQERLAVAGQYEWAHPGVHDKWGMCPPQGCVHSLCVGVPSSRIDRAYPTEFIGLRFWDLHVLVSVGFATLDSSAPAGPVFWGKCLVSGCASPPPPTTRPPKCAVRAMSFSTVAGPNLGQRPTFDPRSSLLWELSTLKVTQGDRRPTAVLNAMGPCAVMGGSVSITRWSLDRHSSRCLDEMPLVRSPPG
jgi:hypothetical protein